MNQKPDKISSTIAALLLPEHSYSKEPLLDFLRRANPTELDEFVDTCMKHRIAPIAGYRLLGIDSKHTSNAPLNQLTNAYHATFYKNQSAIALFERLGSHLSDRGIRYAGIKGIYMLSNVYPDIGMRPMADIDILVAPHEFVHATVSVLEMGAKFVHEPIDIGKKIRSIPFIGIDLIYDFIDYINRLGMREALIQHSKTGWYIEIQQSVSRPGEPRGWIDAKAMLDVEKTPPWPKPETEFILQAIDVFDKGGKAGLLAATDLLWLMETKDINPNKLLAVAEELNLTPVVYAAFGLIQEMLGIKVDDYDEPMVRRLLRKFVSADLSNTPLFWRLSYLQKGILPLAMSQSKLHIIEAKVADTIAFRILTRTNDKAN